MTEVAETFDLVHDILTKVIGEEFIEEYDVDMSSTLTGDLEMESIEIVELVQAVKVKCGDQSDMSEWMAKLSLEQLVTLKISDVCKFIDDASSH